MANERLSLEPRCAIVSSLLPQINNWAHLPTFQRGGPSHHMLTLDRQRPCNGVPKLGIILDNESISGPKFYVPTKVNYDSWNETIVTRLRVLFYLHPPSPSPHHIALLLFVDKEKEGNLLVDEEILLLLLVGEDMHLFLTPSFSLSTKRRRAISSSTKRYLLLLLLVGEEMHLFLLVGKEKEGVRRGDSDNKLEEF